MIDFDDFKKMVLKTGTIQSVEKHPKADRLYVVQVNVGNEIVQVVSGLVEHFSIEELLGKSVVVVTNLQPANLRGVASNGMILAAQDSETMTLVSGGHVADGTIIS